MKSAMRDEMGWKNKEEGQKKSDTSDTYVDKLGLLL